MRTSDFSIYKNPFPYSVWLSTWDWKESYAELKKMVELSLKSAETKVLSDKPKLQIKVSDLAKVQMHVYHLIIEDESFRNFWNKNKKPLSIKKDLIKVAKNALEMIEEICKELKSDFYPKKSYELDEYKSKKYPARSINIDKNNMFVYQVVPKSNTLQILEVMFHYDDKPLNKNVTQRIMVDMFNVLNISKERKEISDYLHDIFDKLKSKEYKRPEWVRKALIEHGHNPDDFEPAQYAKI
jgi:hypothetical protein